jgi:hypothetical protein
MHWFGTIFSGYSVRKNFGPGRSVYYWPKETKEKRKKERKKEKKERY